MSVLRSQLLLLFLCFAAFLDLHAQPIQKQLDSLTAILEEMDAQRSQVLSQLEGVKLNKIRVDLKAWGLPDSAYITHSAMMLSYNEEHEQANWVAHIILPDIKDGAVTRTNDFRPDPKVKTGTAVEADYFLKYLQEDSSYVYDGFGYDRGHLAPSADFRWSYTALSESYYYSNMTPQRPGFNRYSWAELENALRSYVYNHPGTQLYVVSGPVLHEDLPAISRSVNGVSIPESYFKIAVDLDRQRGIGFIMPNRQISAPIETFAKPIREIEAELGYDFGSNLPAEIQDKIETQTEVKIWLDLPESDVQPLDPTQLSQGHFNTIQAKIHMGKNREIIVCGTVVSMRKSKSGNIWMNLDKNFPNHVFSAYIPKDKVLGFPFNPMEQWSQKELCIEGVVQNFDNTPTIRIDRSKQISPL